MYIKLSEFKNRSIGALNYNTKNRDLVEKDDVLKDMTLQSMILTLKQAEELHGNLGRKIKIAKSILRRKK